jgi:hypothetical protein
MGVKRRKTQFIWIADDLGVEFYYVAYGRADDDEVRVYIKDKAVMKVTVGPRESEIAKADLLNSIPQVNVMPFIWGWLKQQYDMRTAEKGGVL